MLPRPCQKTRHYKHGDVIFVQGDIGIHQYKIKSGSVSVHVGVGIGGVGKHVATLSSGRYFGSLALESPNNIRTATVIAQGPTTLEIVEEKQTTITTKCLGDTSKPNDDSLLTIEEMCFTGGQTILTQGDIGTSFYLLSKGVVDITIDDNVTGRPPVKVNTLVSGEIFGEGAVLNTNQRRTANVVAKSKSVKLLKMTQRRGTSAGDKGDIQNMLERRHHENKANQRLFEEAQARAKGNQPKQITWGTFDLNTTTTLPLQKSPSKAKGLQQQECHLEQMKSLKEMKRTIRRRKKSKSKKKKKHDKRTRKFRRQRRTKISLGVKNSGSGTAMSTAMSKAMIKALSATQGAAVDDSSSGRRPEVFKDGSINASCATGVNDSIGSSVARQTNKNRGRNGEVFGVNDIRLLTRHEEQTRMARVGAAAVDHESAHIVGSMQQHSFKTTTFASETIVDTRYYQYRQDLLLARSAITAKKCVEDGKNSTCTIKTATGATAIGCVGDWEGASALPEKEKVGGIGKKLKKRRQGRKKTKKKKQTELGKEQQHLRLFEDRLKNMSDFERYVFQIKQERKERDKKEQEDEVDGSFRVIARAGQNVGKKVKKKVTKKVKLEYRPWTGVQDGKVDANDETTWMPYEGGLVSIDSFFKSRKRKDGDPVLQVP